MDNSIWSKDKRDAILRVLLSALLIVFFVCVVFVYYRMLVNETREDIINKGRINAVEQAAQINSHISSSLYTLKHSGYTIDSMVQDGFSREEILTYITAESEVVMESHLTETTGIYGYILGEYMDGSGWVPDADYVPTERPWYTETIAGSDEITIVDPYVDLYTGSVMITLAYRLSDQKSVVAIDVLLDDIQQITEEHVKNNRSYAEFIINGTGEIVAHSDKRLVGTVLNDGSDYLTDIIGRRMAVMSNSNFYMELDDRDYLVYVMPLENNWTCVSMLDATEEFAKLKIPLYITILTMICITSVLTVFTIRLEKKSREVIQTSVKTERALAANEAKTSFLSNMSHEIRTPINGILGMNEMILREETDGDIISYAENIKNAGNTLLGLINDVLDFSKIESGRMEIVPVDYDLASVINDLVNMVKMRADAKGLNLEVKVDKDIPNHLHGDEVRIKQVITNILTNAVKYTENGSVTFTMSSTKIASMPDEIILNVSISDTGIGIRDEDMEKLFGRFDRIDGEHNRNIEGSGLGMSITRNLLDMMGSSLHVESVYGEGSTFGFALRQRVISWEGVGDFEAAFRLSQSRRARYKERFTAPSATVLVVDDNPMNLIVFSSLIKKTLIKVDNAKDGDEGIKMSGEKKYDVIFLDHMMPGKDGIETLHEIQADPQNPNRDTTIICLTANAISGARARYIAEGFDDYLTKPIDGDRLEEMLFEYLPSDKIASPKEEANRILKEIKEAADLMDCDKLEKAVEALMPDSIISAELSERIKRAASDYDYDEVIKLTEEYDTDNGS